MGLVTFRRSIIRSDDVVGEARSRRSGNGCCVSNTSAGEQTTTSVRDDEE